MCSHLTFQRYSAFRLASLYWPVSSVWSSICSVKPNIPDTVTMRMPIYRHRSCIQPTQVTRSLLIRFMCPQRPLNLFLSFAFSPNLCVCACGIPIIFVAHSLSRSPLPPLPLHTILLINTPRNPFNSALRSTVVTFQHPFQQLHQFVHQSSSIERTAVRLQRRPGQQFAFRCGSLSRHIANIVSSVSTELAK